MRAGETVLLGRDPECQEIDAVIANVRAHAGASLVLAGGTGIGKTTLLRYAAQRAGGARVLTTCGVSAEQSLPFAGLHGLLRPVLGLLEHIPARQTSSGSWMSRYSPSLLGSEGSGFGKTGTTVQ